MWPLQVLGAIFAMNAVRQIPVPVLYGVFLYMGIVSLGGNQFINRVAMLAMQPSKYPPTAFTGKKGVAARTTHYFTLLQVCNGCGAAPWSPFP